MSSSFGCVPSHSFCCQIGCSRLLEGSRRPNGANPEMATGAAMYGSNLPLHWDPLTATVEVWAGDNLDRLQFIASSLGEVGIPSRSLTDDPQNLRLLVRPEDETNAREVVRQILEAAAPERSIRPVDDDIWRDEPVRSYLFAWLPTVIYAAIIFLVRVAYAPPGQFFTPSTPFDPLFSFISWANQIVALWMIYQAIRYEIQPWRFILLSFLPFSFIWYYYERYSRRDAYGRLPMVVRGRMAQRPSA